MLTKFLEDQIDSDMVIGSYANVGPGIAFLFLLIAIGVGLFVWISFWVSRGFRANVGTSKSPAVARSCAAIMIALLFVFPPFRQAGDWRNATNATPTDRSATYALDRRFFGRIPVYGWIGESGSVPKQPLTTISKGQIDNRGPYTLTGFKWTIDWWYLVLEWAAVGVLSLPFLRRPRPSGSDGSPK